MRWTMMAAVALACVAATTPALAAEPVQVMVLGTYHFGNPGLDLNNVQAEDVTTPQRQAELAALADALAGWKPTKVLVEAEADDLIDHRYDSFAPEVLKTERNETIQIGYRVARQAGLSTVHAIDEQPADGEPDYFPFDKVATFAGAHAQQPIVDGLMAFGKTQTDDMTTRQKRQAVPALLAHINRPEAERADIAAYYRLLAVGDAKDQPGADLNAMWYLRNAKIFAKLMRVAQPGDRVLVIYGSGHNYWLRHFARSTEGYANVDPLPVLNQAALR